MKNAVKRASEGVVNRMEVLNSRVFKEGHQSKEQKINAQSMGESEVGTHVRAIFIYLSAQ